MAIVGVVYAIILLICSSVMPTLAIDYTVGDSKGWIIGMDYSTWAKGKTFAVGDTLVFSYGGGHTVDEVSGSDYSSCTVGNSLTSDSSGATSITLKTPGPHYFICAVSGHCSSGMKLTITVGGSTATGGGGAGGGSTPGGGASTPTTPSTSTPSTPNTIYFSSSTKFSPSIKMLLRITLLGIFVLSSY